MLREEEFNLPVQADQMLYSVEGYGVVDNDVQQARQMLRGLKDSPGLVNAYKTCDFWLDYLERRSTALLNDQGSDPLQSRALAKGAAGQTLH